MVNRPIIIFYTIMKKTKIMQLISNFFVQNNHISLMQLYVH
jgi:hypothetical protein